MLVVHTTIRLDPARREEAMDVVSNVVESSSAEDGTVRYQAMEDLTEPNVVRFFEQYEDLAAARAHQDSEHYRRFVEALPDVTDGKIETVQFETDDVHATEFTADAAVEALD